MLPLLLLLLAVIDGIEGDGSIPPKCTKDWLRYVVINACNHSKRHIKLVDQFIKVSGDFFIEPEIIERRAERKRREVEKIWWKHIHAGTLYDGKHLEKEIIEESTDLERSYRSIKELVEKCCKSHCELSEFRGICFA